MSMKTTAIAIVTTATLAATSVFAGGHASPESQAVAARQAHMNLYAFNLGVLGGMAKGSVDYNAEFATSIAGDLATLAKMSQAAYWPQGTAQGEIEGSRALASAWANYEETVKLSMDLAAAADAMVAAAGTLEGLQGGMAALGGACGACHKATRGPKN